MLMIGTNDIQKGKACNERYAMLLREMKWLLRKTRSCGATKIILQFTYN